MLAGALGSPTPTASPERGQGLCDAPPQARGTSLPRAPLAVSSFSLVVLTVMNTQGRPVPSHLPCPLWASQTVSFFLRATLLCSWGSGRRRRRRAQATAQAVPQTQHVVRL